jgi:hypothetical protein
VREVLRHDQNAWLCQPDNAEALVAGLNRLMEDKALAERLATAAQTDSAGLTWAARGARISAILIELLQAPGTTSARWDKAQSQRWRRLSWRWLQHLRRSRFWVLPPDELPDDSHG